MKDVPLRELMEATERQRDRVTLVGALGIIAVFAAIVWGNERTHVATIAGMEKATRIALDAANEKGVAHNGLIDRMREMARQYVTWPTVVLLLMLSVSIAALVLK